MNNKIDILKYGKYSLDYSARKLNAAQNKLDKSFVQIVELIANTDNKVILTGIGKSGLIARKISSTLINIGLISYFVHPSDSRHGDLGIIRKNDIIITISNSGETEELLKFILAIRKLRLSNKIIAITCSKKSNLAKNADISICTHVKSEAFEKSNKLHVTPITSSTITLAIGDALCATIQKVKWLNNSLALHHPGGTIGKILNGGKNKRN